MRARHFESYGCNEMEQQTRYFQCRFDFQSARTRTIVKYISDFSKINVRGMKSAMDSTTVFESECC